MSAVGEPAVVREPAVERDVATAHGAQTADRALRLLLLAVDSAAPLGLVELGRRAGLNNAATYRLLRPLVNRRLLSRDSGGRGYTVGPGLIGLAARVMSGLRVREVARPMLVRLAEHTAETVSLHARHSQQRVCVDVVEGSQPVRRVVPVGESVSLYAGPSGKVILAWLPSDEADLILESAVAEGHDRKSLVAQLKRVRADGYLATVGDRFPGVGGLSVPVFGGTHIVGAVTVSGPADRFGLKEMVRLAPTVMEACADISAALGYTGGAPSAGRASGSRAASATRSSTPAPSSRLTSVGRRSQTGR